jgi:hypothetical protein
MHRRSAHGIAAPIIASVVCVLALFAATAASAWAAKEYSLPSHITIETRKFSFPNDPHRCVAWAFAEFPKIRGAKGYEVTVADTVHGTRETYSGPLFPDDHWDDYPAHYDVHDGFHWFALSGYSVGSGCADAILGLEGDYKIVRAKVSLEKAYQRRLRPPRRGWKVRRCHGPGQSPRLGKPGGKLLLIKIGGAEAGAIIKSENVPRSSIGQGTFVTEASILETNRRSAVMIQDRFSGDWTTGGAVVIGPGMKVRIQPGKRIEVLHRDPNASWDDVLRIRQAPAGRGINIGCMSARG